MIKGKVKCSDVADVRFVRMTSFVVPTSVQNKLSHNNFSVLFGCEMWIGILRDKQQIEILRMLTVEGQDVIKTVGKIVFVYLFCIKLC